MDVTPASHTSILQPQVMTTCSTPRPTSAVDLGQARDSTTSSKVPHLAVGTSSVQTQLSAPIFVTNCPRRSAKAVGCSLPGDGSAVTPALSSTVQCHAQPSSENTLEHNSALTEQHRHLCQRLQRQRQGPHHCPRLYPHTGQRQLPHQTQQQFLRLRLRLPLRQRQPLP